MKKINLLLCITFIVILLVGCGENKAFADTTDVIDTVKDPEAQQQESPYTYKLLEFGETDSVSIDGQTFDYDYINTVLLESINNKLYFYDRDDSLYLFSNSNLLLGKSIEYDLYYVHNTDEWYYEHMIYVVFANESYPLKENEVYELGYSITAKGMSHELYSMKPAIYDSNYGSNINNSSYQFLGKFNMEFNGIAQPEFDEISDDQCKAIDSGVKSFMETDNTILEPGTYSVYVRGFYQADSSANIFFVHENGDTYYGILWGANKAISESDSPTIPYRVSKYEEAVGAFEDYMELIKEHSVFYGIYEKPVVTSID